MGHKTNIAFIFILTVFFSVANFANPMISARVGYLEGILPSLEVLRSTISGLLTTPMSRREAGESIKTWNLIFFVLYEQAEKSTQTELAYAPIAAMSEAFDKAQWASGDFEPNSKKALLATLQILEKGIADIHLEITNPDQVDRQSKAYVEGRNDGLRFTAEFFTQDLSTDASRIKRMNESRDISMFSVSIALTQTKIRVLQKILLGMGYSEMQSLLEDYLKNLEIANSKFPAPYRLYASSKYQQKVREAAANLKEIRNMHLKKLRNAFEIRIQTLARSWDSPAGSCHYTFRLF